MTTQYQFDFGKMTWADTENLPKGGLVTFEILDKLAVGGIRELSINEVTEVLIPQFIAAYAEWMKHGKIGDIMPELPRKGHVSMVFKRYLDDDELKNIGIDDEWKDSGITTSTGTFRGGLDGDFEVDDSADDDTLSGMLDDIAGLD